MSADAGPGLRRCCWNGAHPGVPCPGPSAEPTPDRLAEAREAVARWLCDDYDRQFAWATAPDGVLDDYREQAAVLLALPELRALIGGEQL